MVEKVHRWSETVLLAQTGAGRPMTRLIQKMMFNRDHDYPKNSTGEGLKSLYSSLRPLLYNEELRTSRSRSALNGTFVVVVASDGIAPAEIFTLDYATGAYTPIGGSGTRYADGTNQTVFQAVADRQFAALSSSASKLPLDVWASNCIQDAVASEPQHVDWPADLAISRFFPGSGRRFILRRIASPITSGIVDFLY